MPPKLPLTRKAAPSLFLSSRPFVCPSCRYKQARAPSNYPARLRSPGNGKARGTTLQFRTASTTASVTAVNVKKDIPHRFRNLHESFKALETEAAVYVNLSQLRLGLRGLESENAITRIAGKSCFYDNNGRTESLTLGQYWVSMGTMDLEGWRGLCWRIL